MVVPGAARGALAAVPQRLHRHPLADFEPAYLFPQLGDLPSILVARWDAGRRRASPVVVVEVRTADAASTHTHEDFTGAGRRDILLPDLDLFFAGEKSGGHLGHVTAILAGSIRFTRSLMPDT
jgi:hypothetical protein